MSAESVEPSIGWGVLHLFFAVDRAGAAEPGAGKRIVDAVRSLEADGHQALTFAVLGHKADVGIMALGPDLARLQAFQAELAGGPLILVDSYVSLTELSEYTATESQERARLADEEGLSGPELDAQLAVWSERMEHYQEHRIHPQLPHKKVISFYPMSKRRNPDANWYTQPFEERRRIMAGHARIGRTYAGRITQLITGSLGLDDWEWGVTLLADDPVTIKEIVYEMRFDEATARYADFGPFIIGLVGDPSDTLGRVGITS